MGLRAYLNLVVSYAQMGVSNRLASSNGRTTDFGSVCVGSNPAGPTITKPFAFAEGFVFRYLKAILIFPV